MSPLDVGQENMNEWLPLLIPFIVLAGVTFFALAVKGLIFLREHECPKCGEKDEVPSLLTTCECQNCGFAFDIVAGRVRLPQSWIKVIWDRLMGLAVAVMILAAAAYYVPMNIWVFAVVAVVLLIDWIRTSRKDYHRFPFGVSHGETESPTNRRSQ